MGQPEMQPERPPQSGRDGEGGAAGPRPGDLTGRAFPLGDWALPAERLDELYRWVERGALDTAAWYLADRVWKRRGAVLLRCGAAAGAVAGAALPLLDLAGAVGGAAPWGYLALLWAVACVAGDRYFGVTAGWMRDVATAQAVQRRLQALQFDWASESVREVLGPAGRDGERGGGAVPAGAAAVLGGPDGAGAGGDGGLDGVLPPGSWAAGAARRGGGRRAPPGRRGRGRHRPVRGPPAERHPAEHAPPAPTGAPLTPGGGIASPHWRV
ncbi:hypothetical protein RKD29_004007 [Streptomyces tendae]